jgi:hypothetical protein
MTVHEIADSSSRMRCVRLRVTNRLPLHHAPQHDDRLLCLLVSLGAPQRAQEPLGTFASKNIALSAVTAGIGAVINRAPHEKVPRALIRGLFYGAAGGAIMFEGKNMTRLIVTQHRLEYACLARTTLSTGVSIVENASAGRCPLTQLHMDVGFVRLDLEPSGRRLQTRILPVALSDAITAASHHDIDWVRSLQIGTTVFQSRGDLGEGSAATIVNSIVYREGGDQREAEPSLAHELVHTFRYEDFSALTYYFARPTERWITPHLPQLARWFYPDFQYAALRVHYVLVEGGGGQHYCANFLEREAIRLGDPAAACPVPHR